MEIALMCCLYWYDKYKVQMYDYFFIWFKRTNTLFNKAI